MTAPALRRDEVLAWMSRTGAGPAEALERFAPGLEGGARQRAHDRIRKWASRARRTSQPDAPAPSRPAVGGHLVPPIPAQQREVIPHYPNVDVVRMDPETFWCKIVADLQGDLDTARAEGRLDRIPALMRELRAAYERLEQIRGSSASHAPLNRDPAEVAARIRERLPHLERLAAARRRAPTVIDAEEE